MLREILTSNGFEVAGEAKNGSEAVSLYETQKPDLVIMDIVMPEMDGLAATEEIKKIDSNAKIVFCSAMGQRDMVMKALGMGARGFIVKPFDAEKLIQTVRKAALPGLAEKGA